MKKIICTVLCVALALATSITSFAEERPYYSPNDTVVTKTIYSRCNICIPETINIERQSILYIEFTEAEIIEGEKVRVKVTNLNENGAITLSNPNSETQMDVYILDSSLNTITADNPYIAILYSSYFASSKTGNVSCTLSTEAYSTADVGVYSGTIQYEVSISPDSLGY